MQVFFFLFCRKSCSKEALQATLKACKILVVDGKDSILTFYSRKTLNGPSFLLNIDAASNRKLLSMMLKRAGFGTVDLVEDGQAAVDYCITAQSQGDLPKMIFMDNTMPRMVSANAIFFLFLSIFCGAEQVNKINTFPYPFLIPYFPAFFLLFPLQTGIDASRIIRQGGYPHLIIGVTGNSMEDELDDFIGKFDNFWIFSVIDACCLICFYSFSSVHRFLECTKNG